MKNNESEKLKKILKPIVQECIREAIFQEGILSTLVAEIVSGMGTTPIVESREQKKPEPQYNNFKVNNYNSSLTTNQTT